MNKLSRSWIGMAAAAAVALAFGLGYWVRAAQHAELTIYRANGYVGADVASFPVGDTTYGFRSNVAWTDSAGTEHDSGWPDCLPRLHSVQAIRFGGAVVWHGSTGEALVLWVDCRA